VVSGDDVSLSWTGAPGPGFTEFVLLRSATRLGFFDGTAVEIAWGGGTAFTDVGALTARREVYYMVLPADSVGGFGGGAYSVGVFRVALSGTTAIGLPLDPFLSGPVSWYAATVPTTFGLLWFDAAAQVWVPHFAAMGREAYDAAVLRATGYQIGVRGSPALTFVGR
jgi:hypothetical protein